MVLANVSMTGVKFLFKIHSFVLTTWWYYLYLHFRILFETRFISTKIRGFIAGTSYIDILTVGSSLKLSHWFWIKLAVVNHVNFYFELENWC